jgi:hypothetical protein
MPDFQESLVNKLDQAAKYFERSPDLISYQILAAVDGLSCVCIGSWKSEDAREKVRLKINFFFNVLTASKWASNVIAYYLQQMQIGDPFAYVGFQKLMSEITYLSVPGTMSDIVDHTGFPNRIYRAFDFESEGRKWEPIVIVVIITAASMYSSTVIVIVVIYTHAQPAVCTHDAPLVTTC